jgi:glucose/arabinose dehydrogenase
MEPGHLPINEPPKKLPWYKNKKYAKPLLAVLGVEVLVLVGLLAFIWTRPAPKVVETPRQTTELAPLAEPKVELKSYASGLTMPTAIAATNDPADRRLFVVEQAGIVRVVKQDGTLESDPFLDIVSKVQAGGEMGLLGLAFHPKLSQNPYFYVNYIDKQRNTIIARYEISDQTGRADTAGEKVLLKIAQPYPNHNGGELAFGPDGYLYIGLGDGGSGGDPENHAQNKNELLGKMLRIDVDKGDPYAVPSDNPFAKDGGKPEIWALGLRNPWRFSFDSKTGDMFIADVGQGEIEEIDFQAKNNKGGTNYGWRCFEGTRGFNLQGCQDKSSYVTPILEYDHTEGRCSVTGGYVYRGKTYPALDGLYFYGDYCGGQIYSSSQSGETWTAVLAASTDRGLSTFGQDSRGELYVANLETGIIHQITDIANSAR